MRYRDRLPLLSCAEVSAYRRQPNRIYAWNKQLLVGETTALS